MVFLSRLYGLFSLQKKLAQNPEMIKTNHA